MSANQSAIYKSYIEECFYLRLTDTQIDNGRARTVFERSKFSCLIDDIQNGTIKYLVVRNLNRFGHDYIETGTYMECLFPQIGLRFISIKEMHGSLDVPEGNENLVISLQNMIRGSLKSTLCR